MEKITRSVSNFKINAKNYFCSSFPFILLPSIWYELLTWNTLIYMNVDKKNRNTTLIALCLIVILGLLALFAVKPEYFERIQSINQNSIPLFLILTGLLLLFLYFLFCRVEPYFESIAKSIQYPQSEEFSETEKHIGIIFPVYTDFLENLSTSDCIGLLIDEFRKSNKKYRVYHIFIKKNFEEAYYNNYVTELWIIGHGSRGSITYGNKGNDKIEYSKLRILDQKKEFIAQLHCNHGQKESLKKINGCDGFVSKTYRTAFWNRGFIIEKFNQKNRFFFRVFPRTSNNCTTSGPKSAPVSSV